ncbi:hypothetical protein [Streptomyces sp. SAJ15]|uniref:hypothetical protein n=1 Tax=Streptomyces sp. SAJ15 TaxID=2011095 RepID=UPI0021B19F8E|nr:hypothetical protein [Streptomyces sp. SAJ15]
MSKVVPLELAHWLLKPASLIQGTWNEPMEATDWFRAHVRMYAPSFASEHHRDETRLTERISRAVEAMRNGEDVAGGWYLTGQGFLSVCLIACSPHRMRPDIACPQR